MEVNIQLDTNKNRNTDTISPMFDHMKFQKMLLLFNAINDGWTIKKQNDAYIFTKNHEGKKEIFRESFLHTFMKDNFDINKLLND